MVRTGALVAYASAASIWPAGPLPINKPVPRDVVLFGEIGLSGELRPVGQEAARLREAERLGFSRALAALTPSGGKGKAAAAKGLAPIGLSRLSDLAEWLREGG